MTMKRVWSIHHLRSDWKCWNLLVGEGGGNHINVYKYLRRQDVRRWNRLPREASSQSSEMLKSPTRAACLFYVTLLCPGELWQEISCEAFQAQPSSDSVDLQRSERVWKEPWWFVSGFLNQKFIEIINFICIFYTTYNPSTSTSKLSGPTAVMF